MKKVSVKIIININKMDNSQLWMDSVNSGGNIWKQGSIDELIEQVKAVWLKSIRKPKKSHVFNAKIDEIDKKLASIRDEYRLSRLNWWNSSLVSTNLG